MWRWLVQLQARAGFELVERDIVSTNASKWDSCVEDISRGLLDLCPTASWVVKNRAKKAVFASPVIWSEFKLLVKVDRRTTRWSIWQAFAPFDGTLYLALSFTVFLTSWIFIIVEGRQDLEPEEHDAEKNSQSQAVVRASTVRSSVLTSLANQDVEHKSTQQIVLAILARLLNSLFYTTIGLFTGDIGMETVTLAGRCVRLGFGFFVLVTVASYTANLAAFLVSETPPALRISSIHEAINMQYPVCLAGQIEEPVRKLYPNLNVVLGPSSTSSVEGLREGLCNASIVPTHDYFTRPDFQRCDEQLTGETLLGMAVATPTSHEIVTPYSYHTIALHQEGEFQTLHNILRATVLHACRVLKVTRKQLLLSISQDCGLSMVYSLDALLWYAQPSSVWDAQGVGGQQSCQGSGRMHLKKRRFGTARLHGIRPHDVTDKRQLPNRTRAQITRLASVLFFGARLQARPTSKRRYQGK
jgi:hypothetical protein